MSDPRASIQRAVAAPPARPAPSTAALLEPAASAPAVTTQLIGKPHGRMRCVNLSLPVEAAEALRDETARRDSTLGEVLIDIARKALVPAAARAVGRKPFTRRTGQTSNVYVLLTPAEALDLGLLAQQSGRSVSDFAGMAVRVGLNR